MRLQGEHSIRQLQTEVAFLADFGPIVLPAEGTFAFQFRLTDPGTHPVILCLYYDDMLEDKVELSFAYSPTCITMLGAAGQAGQRVSDRVQQLFFSPYAPWTYTPPVARPNLRGMLLSYWRTDGLYGTGSTARRSYRTDFLP